MKKVSPLPSSSGLTRGSTCQGREAVGIGDYHPSPPPQEHRAVDPRVKPTAVRFKFVYRSAAHAERRLRDGTTIRDTIFAPSQTSSSCLTRGSTPRCS